MDDTKLSCEHTFITGIPIYIPSTWEVVTAWKQSKQFFKPLSYLRSMPKYTSYDVNNLFIDWLWWIIQGKKNGKTEWKDNWLHFYISCWVVFFHLMYLGLTTHIKRQLGIPNINPSYPRPGVHYRSPSQAKARWQIFHILPTMKSAQVTRGGTRKTTLYQSVTSSITPEQGADTPLPSFLLLQANHWNIGKMDYPAAIRAPLLKLERNWGCVLLPGNEIRDIVFSRDSPLKSRTVYPFV